MTSKMFIFSKLNGNIYILGVCKSDRIRSDFGTKIYISDQIDKVVS